MLDRLVDAFRPKPKLPSTHTAKEKQATAFHARAQAEAARKKKYVRPTARRLSFEQGALILVGRAWDGDERAKELLTHMFPSNVESQDVFVSRKINEID
jgi:hypothetical protein